MTAAIKREGETYLLYVGFMRFVQHDRVWPSSMSKSAIKRECSRVARAMITRNTAFSRLVDAAYPRSVRFSIHAHNGAGPKYPVELVPSFDGRLRTVRGARAVFIAASVVVVFFYHLSH